MSFRARRYYYLTGVFVFVALSLACIFHTRFSSDGGNKPSDIVVSTLLPMTGNGAESCPNAIKALSLCVEKWNKKDVFGGRRLVLDINDSKSEAKHSVTVASKLTSVTKPRIVICSNSAVSLSTQPIFEKGEIIQIVFAATDKLFENNPKYTLRIMSSVDQTCKLIAAAIEKKFDTNKFHFYFPSSEFGVSTKRAIDSLAEQGIINLLSVNEYDEKQNDHRNIIAKSNIKNDDIVYVAGSQSALGRLIRQIRSSGFSGKIVGAEDISSAATMSIIGEMRENIFYIELSKAPAFQDLNREFHEKYGEDLYDFSLMFYNALDFVLSAMRDSDSLDNASVMKRINTMEYEGYLGENRVEHNEIIYSYTMRAL